MTTSAERVRVRPLVVPPRIGEHWPGALAHAAMIGAMIPSMAAPRSAVTALLCAFALVILSIALAPLVRRRVVTADHILDLWLMVAVLLWMSTQHGVAPATATAASGHQHGVAGIPGTIVLWAIPLWLAARVYRAWPRHRRDAAWYVFTAMTAVVTVVMIGAMVACAI